MAKPAGSGAYRTAIRNTSSSCRTQNAGSMSQLNGALNMETLATGQMSRKGLRSELTTSQSVQDVRDVAPPVPTAKRGSATNLLAGSGTTIAVQEHENETAEIVIVCEPQGTSLMMGGLHPRASLYERPVNLDAAKSAHAEFRQVMREAGVKVRPLSVAHCGVGPVSA